MNITANESERVFVVSTGSSFGSLPFKTVFYQALELARRLQQAGKPAPTPLEEEIGTLAQYHQYQSLLSDYQQVNDQETWFDDRTPAPVQAALERLRASNGLTRLFFGDAETGRSWLVEDDVVGRIRRTQDAMKLPMLVGNAGSDGPILLTHCIVRIIDIDGDGEVYRHPTFHLPKMELKEAASYDRPFGFTHAVWVEGVNGEMELHQNFRSPDDAHQWMAFLACDTYG